ncbi:hypothetical protein MTO96_024974 [Rhipicephalus appendiculatus]
MHVWRKLEASGCFSVRFERPESSNRITSTQGRGQSTCANHETNGMASAHAASESTITSTQGRKATCATYETNVTASAPAASECTITSTQGRGEATCTTSGPASTPRCVGEHHHIDARPRRSHVHYQWPGQRPRSVGEHHLRRKAEEKPRALPI